MILFTFTETAITACLFNPCHVGPFVPIAGPGGIEILGFGPLQIGLTISNPTETGSAIFGRQFGVSVPQVSDPGFGLSIDLGTNEPGGVQVSGPDFGFPPGSLLSYYDVTWTASGGQLTAVSIGYLSEGTSTEIGLHQGFGLAGGDVGSDGYIGGCGDGVCVISGFWTDPAPLIEAPEPASLLLFATALGCAVLLGHHRYRGLEDRRRYGAKVFQRDLVGRSAAGI